jgi:hypothetical protein
MFCDVEYCEMVMLPVFHHSSPTISIAETIYEMHVGVFLIFKRTATEQSSTRLDSAQTQEPGKVIADTARFASA